MTAQDMILGFHAHYPAAMHPVEQARNDLLRIIKSLKYTEDQYSGLYDIILKDCQYYPRPFDVMSCAGKVGTVKKNPGEMTPAMFEEERRTYGACSLREWLDSGGLQEIYEQWAYDEARVRKHLDLLRLFDVGPLIERDVRQISDYDDSVIEVEQEEKTNWEEL